MRKFEDMRAALVAPDGTLYLGNNHGTCMLDAIEDGRGELAGDWCEGFHCEAFGFLTRQETEEAVWEHDENEVEGESMDLGGALGLPETQLGVTHDSDNDAWFNAFSVLARLQREGMR